MPVIIASFDIALYINSTSRGLYTDMVILEHLIDNGAALIVFNHVECFGLRV